MGTSNQAGTTEYVQPEFVGRTDQLAALRSAVDDPPCGRIVVVSGPFGSGKTGLLNFASHYALTRGLRVLALAGSPGEVDTPFAALHQLLHILDAGQRTSGSDTSEARAQRELIDAVLRSAGDQQIETARVAMALLDLLATQERREPVLLCIDDAHWLDERSRSALLFAARRSSGRSLTVVVALPTAARWLAMDNRRTIDIELPPLARRDAAALLDRQPSPPRGALREQIIAQAAGCPAALIAFAASAADEPTAGLLPEPPP
ncbi:MAG TPA: ATP-binding protein, partial [Mycobacterium sp.]|nr:ATP-binding protein [Mycobacterium sp.]